MSTPTHAILPAATEEARHRWAELKTRCTGAGAFDDLEFVTGLARTQRLGCDVLFTEVAGEDRFGVALPSRQVGPFRDAILPRFCPTSPLLLAREPGTVPDNVVVQSGLEHVLARYHRVGIHVPSHLIDRVSHPRWTSTLLATYVFDLRSLSADVTEGWSAGTRRLYRKNVDSFDVGTSAGDTLRAVQLCAEGYRRSGRPLPVDVQSTARFAAHPQGDVHTGTYVARSSETGEVDAGIVVLRHEDTAFYWIAGSRPGAAMTVLIGRVLEDLRANDVGYFDFLGANTPSIAEFKRRFGPKLQEYRRLSVCRSRFLALLLASRARLRSVTGI